MNDGRYDDEGGALDKLANVEYRTHRRRRRQIISIAMRKYHQELLAWRCGNFMKTIAGCRRFKILPMMRSAPDVIGLKYHR